MNESTTEGTPGTADQRDKLLESEKKAAVPQPESFKDEAIDDKVVEIGPITPGSDAIKGLDPK